MAYQILHILGTAQPEGTGMVRIVRALAKGLDPERYGIHAWFLEGAGPQVDLLREGRRPGQRARLVARDARSRRGLELLA